VTRARRHLRDAEAGMTLLEVMLVLGLMGLLLVLGAYTLRAVTKSALRADTTEVAAALKAARNLAAESGTHHRVVFDLDQHTYQIEACPDPVQLEHGEDQEALPDQEALTRLAQQQQAGAQGGAGQPGLGGAAGAGGMGMGPLAQLGALGLGGASAGLSGAVGEVADAESPEQALKAAAAISGVRVGTARCGIAPASGGDLANYADPQAPNVHKLSDGDGIVIRRVHVAHLRKPVEKGQVSIHFFPLGQAEKAVVELVDRDGDQFTVLLWGLTGRVEVRDGEVDPDKHMRRNAAGDEVDEP
jgi:type II secretory pathway pseudopilin PulG